jgi:hypothetical protein
MKLNYNYEIDETDGIDENDETNENDENELESSELYNFFFVILFFIVMLGKMPLNTIKCLIERSTQSRPSPIVVSLILFELICLSGFGFIIPYIYSIFFYI